MPDLHRRVVPVGSYIVATAPLEPAVAARLIPRGRVLSDTKNLLYYFRLSPDRRMVFGGRAAFTPVAGGEERAILARGMDEVFPELAGTPIEYAWGGHLGFTRDELPHAGRLDGDLTTRWATAATASRWPPGSAHGWERRWRGRRPLPRLPSGFGPIPLYDGTPWFLPLVGA